MDKMYSQSQNTGLEQKKTEADIRLKDLKAERLELELKEIRGQFHRSEDVEAITNEFVFAVRSALLALPGRLAIDIAPAMTPDEASVRIRKEVSAILIELSGFEYDPEKYKNRAEERLKLQLSAEDDEEKED